MSHFIGIVAGRSSEASRLGTKSSGITVDAASYKGKIQVQLSHDEESVEDRFIIVQERHQGAGIYEHIASGVLGETINKPAK